MNEKFMMGNHACVEGAIAAGCRFYGGYPITPSSEIAEIISSRLPEVGGHYIQMEDEIASIAAILGASCAGLKSMTATSGPGFSLMMENIGFGMITETPCVIVNVQRAGPSTGIPTLIGQGDVMQTKWGSHGDYEAIAYVPNSPQEMFDLTVKAFNASEKYRQPVVLLADQIIAHMSGKVVIPEKVDVEERKRLVKGGVPFSFSEDSPAMAIAGDGHRVNVDSLCHDERGYPSTNHVVGERMLSHLVGKVRNNAKKIWDFEERFVNDADVIVVSYGATSRSAMKAVSDARKKGIKAGHLRLKTVWPFPSDIIRKASEGAKRMIVPEINYGQLVHSVMEFAECDVIGLSHAPGSLIEPEKILSEIGKAV